MTDVKQTVLVVDDETLIVDTLVTILNMKGFVAQGCYSGEEAIRLCEELHPDIVISDVVMKGISGIVLGIRLKESGCKARILLMSGQATTNDLLEEAKTRGYEFEILAKPLHPTELIERLKRAVNSDAKTDS